MKLYRCLIILLTIIGLLFIGTGTVSYFVRNVEGTVSATTDNLVLNVTGFDDEVNKVINFGQIAPGSEGEFTLNLNMTGSSSDVIYTVDIERTNLPDSLKFYYDDVHISPFLNCSKFIAYNASSMTDTVVIYWYWDGEIDDENDTLFVDEEISASISVNVEAQVYGTMKNSSTNGTEFWSNTYRPYIRTISFERGIDEVPSTCDVANLCWDISALNTQEHHVYAYMIDSGFKNTNVSYTIDATLYNLYIVCDRKIYAPSSCSALFSNMKNLINISFDGNFNTSKVINMHQMFSNCSGLTDLDLNNFNTSNVTNMWYMFSNCSSLTSLDLSGFNTGNVTTMNSMFSGCSSLTSLDLSSFNTNNVTMMYYMFGNCLSLVGLDLSNFNTDNVASMGSMFSKCSSLVGLDLNNLNISSVTDMSNMFSGCAKLSMLDFSDFNTNNVTNMNAMFSN